MSGFKYLGYFNQILKVQLAVYRRVLHWLVADPLTHFIVVQRDLVPLRTLRLNFVLRIQFKLLLAMFATDSQKNFLLQMEKQAEFPQKRYLQAMHCLMLLQTESQFVRVRPLQTSFRRQIHRFEVFIQTRLEQYLNCQIVTLVERMVVYQKMTF